MQESGCPVSVEASGLRVVSLPFSSLPGQSKLFLDFQRDPALVKKFYPSILQSHTEAASRVPEVLSNYKIDRSILCDALGRINTSLGATEKTIENINLLRDPKTVTVLTGQQTGLFTGPLYSIYKALSTIRMSECLRGRGIQSVPVFWMATEDHDFEEISNAFVIGNGGELAGVDVVSDETSWGKPVGTIELDGSVSTAIGNLFDSLPATEFTVELRALLKSAWAKGNGIGNAFGKMLTALLGGYGLIIVDPLDVALKQLASPIYAEATVRSSEIVTALTARSTELEAAGYHAQVLVENNYFPLFWHSDDGRRLALRRTSADDLQVKGERTQFSQTQLGELALTEPGRLSPGVMLRPVVQDYLFPTVCYFGGGAEIAYFAQNSEVYRILGRPVTPILHRQSLTVLESKHARTLAEYDLEFADLFAGMEEIIPGVVDQYIDPNTARLFADAEERINTELNRLDQSLSQLDVTLAANLATRRRKIIYHIAALRKKYHFRRAEKDDVIGRRLRAVFTALVPNGQLQERTLNVTSFLDRLGPAFIDIIYNSIDLEDKGHRLIYL